MSAFFVHTVRYGQEIVGVLEHVSRTGAELVVDALIDSGVKLVFAYPGGAVMPLRDHAPDTVTGGL